MYFLLVWKTIIMCTYMIYLWKYITQIFALVSDNSYIENIFVKNLSKSCYNKQILKAISN